MKAAAVNKDGGWEQVTSKEVKSNEEICDKSCDRSYGCQHGIILRTCI